MELKTITLAKNTARAKDGDGFQGDGNWLVIKCFYETEDGYAEFYFSFNPKTQEAELQLKDPDYTHDLIAALMAESSKLKKWRKERGEELAKEPPAEEIPF